MVNTIDDIYELTKEAWAICTTVMDPEIPVLSVTDLGIVRNIEVSSDKKSITITITPTYSGCPAMDAIAMSLKMVFLGQGYKEVNVVSILSPAWTTDWISLEGKEKLKAYGIAAPNPIQPVCDNEYFSMQQAVQCPRCNSYHTTLISQFGSTPCKALYKCENCQEPFDYFKCH
jgi:ring-1,2-phenylacetyl-CoA epoxidase subunit PaaD